MQYAPSDIELHAKVCTLRCPILHRRTHRSNALNVLVYCGALSPLPISSFRFCVCIRVFTTHNGFVTNKVATPAPAAAVMWTRGVDFTLRPVSNNICVSNCCIFGALRVTSPVPAYGSSEHTTLGTLYQKAMNGIAGQRHKTHVLSSSGELVLYMH